MFIFFFFFQAEDGIRDSSVTGVQTCALPIFRGKRKTAEASRSTLDDGEAKGATAIAVHALNALSPYLDRHPATFQTRLASIRSQALSENFAVGIRVLARGHGIREVRMRMAGGVQHT